MRVAVRWLGGVFARSRASSAAPAVALPRAIPRRTAATCVRRVDEPKGVDRRSVAAALQRAEAVASEQYAFDHGLRRGRPVDHTRSCEARREDRVLAGGPGERGRGVADVGDRQSPLPVPMATTAAPSRCGTTNV